MIYDEDINQIVDEGIDEIFKELVAKYEVQHGDIDPIETFELENLTIKLRRIAVNFVRNNTEGGDD